MAGGRKPPSYPKRIITSVKTLHMDTQLFWQTDTTSTNTDWVTHKQTHTISLPKSNSHSFFDSSRLFDPIRKDIPEWDP